jgi:hypothetical protein
MYPNWRLLWIDTNIPHSSICIAATEIGVGTKWAEMELMNKWEDNAIMLDHKMIISHMIG